jgi:hypothetical protein
VLITGKDTTRLGVYSMKVKMRINNIYEVEWTDSTSFTGWTKKEELYISKCKTIGKLVRDEKDFIALAGSYGSDNEDVNTIMCIPKCNIIDKRKVGFK